jgi:flagellin
MLQSLTDSASTLGAINARIEMQDDFVSTLMDVISKGVGRLIDADMNEESTKLKALQTQQQLGIQSLTIANTNSQNILALFQG